MAVQRRRLSADSEPVVGMDDAGNPIKAETPRPAMRATRTDEREPVHETNHGAPRRTRRRKNTVQEDMFYIPIEEIPEDSSYEWKRWSVHGQEDPFYIAQLRDQGWEPVNPKRHPNWVPPGYSQPHIIKGGQILMERPRELTEEARAENRKLARTQVREAEQRLGKSPDGTLTRQHELLSNRVVKEMVRPVMTVQDE